MDIIIQNSEFNHSKLYRMNPVYYNDEEYKEILAYLNQLTNDAEMLPYPNAKELTAALLKYFDLVHREALARMMGLIDTQYPNLKRDLENDFTIKTLLDLYDLGTPEKKENGQSNGRMGFVPVEQVKLLSPIMETVWADAGNVATLKNRQLYPKELAGENVLLCKIDQQVYAIRNACLDSVLPMQFGTIEGYHLVCPWHGCRYDIRNGICLDKPNEKLPTYRIARERTGDFKVGILKEKR